MSERVKGTVKWFDMHRGFGFITPDDRSEDVFFMFVANSDGGYPSINANEAVEFVIGTGDDGRTRAYDVTTPGGGAFLGDDREVRIYGGRGGYAGGGRRCYTCGEEGHLFRNCPQGGGGRGGYRGGGGRRGCYQCGEMGHLFRDCPYGGGGGYGGGWCNGAGHGGRRCYKCGEMGHIFRNCPQGGGHGCFSCGEFGHIARDCINC